jgi:hypothetical protein
MLTNLFLLKMERPFVVSFAIFFCFGWQCYKIKKQVQNGLIYYKIDNETSKISHEETCRCCLYIFCEVAWWHFALSKSLKGKFLILNMLKTNRWRWYTLMRDPWMIFSSHITLFEHVLYLLWWNAHLRTLVFLMHYTFCHNCI